MKIIFLDTNTIGSDIDISIFNQLGEFISYPYTKKEEVADRIEDAEVIITNKVILNKSNLQFAPKLKQICVTATGVNNIDIDYTKVRNITVSNVKGYCTNSVAQHTFAMLFYLYENLPYYDKYVKDGKYVNDKMFTHFDKKFHELQDKNWGIIGLGDIGRKVANIAQAFGCNISYYSTSGLNNTGDYKQTSLDDLLKQSDIISIHAPLNQNTLNLITYKELSKMKNTAYILNLGRGNIINEQDLVRTIKEDKIAGAALDVLSEEPMRADNPLRELSDNPKLFITPHIAWASIEARIRVIQEVYKNILKI